MLFIPIAPEQLAAGMDRLFDYIDKGKDIPLIKAAVSHVEFEALHPFQDGNGRIGRMIITLLLWSSGVISAPHFYISGYMEEHKDRYIDTMREVSKSNNWTSWCHFFLKAVEAQAFRNLEKAEQIRGLYESLKPEFARLAAKWSIHALDFVFTNPYFRNNRFTNSAGIPPSSAANITKALLDKGLLKMVGRCEILLTGAVTCSRKAKEG